MDRFDSMCSTRVSARTFIIHIYLNDLFFTIKNIVVCNFADDTIPYVCDESIEKVLRLLEENTELALC